MKSNFKRKTHRSIRAKTSRLGEAREFISEMRSQRRKMRGKISSLGKVIVRHKIFSLTIGLMVVCFLLIGLRYFLFSTKFNIREIKVHGNEHLEKSFVEGKLSYLVGQNIFLVRSSGLGNDVQRISSYIYSVQVEKELPDTIVVTIEERKPKFLWINLAGVFLLDDQGMVLEVQKDFQNLDLSIDDVDLLKGYGAVTEPEELNTPLPTEEEITVEQSSEESLSEVEEESKEEQSLNAKEKLVEIEQARQEVVARVENYWQSQLEGFPMENSQFPIVYSYESQDYHVSYFFSPSLVEITSAGISIDFLPDKVDQYIWESDFRFVIYLKNLSKIVFSTRRDFGEQIEDLRILLKNFSNKNISFSYVDLSSESIVYEIDK